MKTLPPFSGTGLPRSLLSAGKSRGYVLIVTLWVMMLLSLMLAGLSYQVVKNRLALKAFESMKLDLSVSFKGKCGLVLAAEEGAIGAAKIVREAMAKAKKPSVVVAAGVIEGEVIDGPAAKSIAVMPDKDTVRAQLAGTINGVARSIATCLQAAGPASLARAMQARIDKAEEA